MSAWKDFVTAALLGAGKSAPPPLPAQFQAMLGEGMAREGEVRFLTEAGALALWRRAGWKPAQDETAITPCEPETAATVGDGSAGHLAAMLAGRCAAVLPEWLGEVARLGRCVPPEFLPALFERARQERILRPRVVAAGGRRGRWLAAANSAWAFGAVDAPEWWETGNRDQRIAFLRGLRAAAPAEARAKIEAVWASEPADVRALFMAELAANLLPDDEPFLERCLDDRSKEVRRAASDLLARMPGSAFVARMLARATPLVRFVRGGMLTRATIEVTLPADPDASAVRDGLDPKIFRQQKQLGEKAVLLVLILSAVPLRHWTDTFQRPPEALLQVAEKQEFGRALATGWAWAALRQRDAGWARALLDSALELHAEFLPEEPLLAVLPEGERAARLTAGLREGTVRQGDAASWLALAAQLATFSGQIDIPLAREVLAALRRESANGIPWNLRATVEALLLRLPPALLAEATEGWPNDQEGVAAAVELLTFRHDALTGCAVPGLAEFNDAAQAVFCFGDGLPMALIRERLIVGEELGGTPDEAPQVPLQRDFQKETKRLRLPPEALDRTLELDLRKPNDLDRSRLLHRLRLLRVEWGKPQTARGKGTFKEAWKLRWEPELELALIENAPWGNTIAAAAARFTIERASQCSALPELTALVEVLMLAELPEAVAEVMRRLENQAALTSDVGHLMDALPSLATVLRYGNVRQTDASMVGHIVNGLVARTCAGLAPACAALNDDAAEEMQKRLNATHSALGTLADETLRAPWTAALRHLAEDDALHGLLGGRCTRLLLDDGALAAESAATRLSRQLSRANPPAQAAAWIEGFLTGSGLVLLHQERLWDLLDGWLGSLTAEHFTEALPLLRRTFSTFAPPERRQMGERAKSGGGGAGPAAVLAEEDIDESRADRLLPTLALLLGVAGNDAKP